MICWLVRGLCVANLIAAVLYIVVSLQSGSWGRAYQLPLALTCLLPVFIFSSSVWKDRTTRILLQVASPLIPLLIGVIPSWDERP